jgi:Flp pilus assembly protein TadG
VSERGQASVETVSAALLLTLCALAVVQLVLVFSAAERAGRIADQAAVLAAEGRPLPRKLAGDATIRVAGGAVRVTAPVPMLPGLPSFHITRRVRLP